MYENLLNKCYNHFLGFIKFWSRERTTENTISGLYFHEESDYSEKNKCDNEVFHSTILQPLQFVPKQKKYVVMRAMRKKLNIFTLQLLIYYQLE